MRTHSNACQRSWERTNAGCRSQCNIPAESLVRRVGASGCILDIGCGDGRGIAACRAVGHTGPAIGVDWSVRAVEAIRDTCPWSRVYHGDCRHLPLADSSVDAAMLVAVLTCFVDSADIEAVIGEALRVIRPGGILCIVDFLLTPNLRCLWRYCVGALRYGTLGAFDSGYPFRHFRRDQVLSWTKSLGGTVLETEVTRTRSWRGHRLRGITLLACKTSPDTCHSVRRR